MCYNRDLLFIGCYVSRRSVSVNSEQPISMHMAWSGAADHPEREMRAPRSWGPGNRETKPPQHHHGQTQTAGPVTVADCNASRQSPNARTVQVRGYVNPAAVEGQGHKMGLGSNLTQTGNVKSRPRDPGQLAQGQNVHRVRFLQQGHSVQQGQDVQQGRRVPNPAVRSQVVYSAPGSSQYGVSVCRAFYRSTIY